MANKSERCIYQAFRYNQFINLLIKSRNLTLTESIKLEEISNELHSVQSQLSRENQLVIRKLGLQDYLTTLEAMQDFTTQRTAESIDEVWFLEHPPVFSQGQAGKAEHLLNTGNIAVIQSNRGGQVTYHGPGQLVVYFLIDIHRKNIAVRKLVNILETLIISTLKQYHINAIARKDAPGVYINDEKICSLGLRIRKGCSFHGLALNVDMDLSPFTRINPCGYQGMKMTQLSHFCDTVTIQKFTEQLIPNLMNLLDYQQVQFKEAL